MTDPQYQLKRWFHEKTAPHGVKARLAEASGFSSTQISRMRNIETDDPKKRQEIPLAMIEKAARFFNELPPGFEGMTQWIDVASYDDDAIVSIVGKAGAGPDGTVLFARGDGNLGAAEAPFYATANTKALEVEGDSMRGIADDGALIFFDEREAPNETHIGELCICWLEDERVMIKYPYQGLGGLWSLESTTATTLRDVPIRWFAHVTSIVPRRTARQIIRSHVDLEIEDVAVTK